MPATVVPIDGRLARSVRSRTAVADAMLDLLQDNDLQPTAARVAERAGVSLRLVFQHFADLEALYAEVADRQAKRLRPLLIGPTSAGPLADRVQAFVTRRAQALETIAPVRRAALLRAPFSPVLTQRLQYARRLARAQVDSVFRPELARHAPSTRQELRAALFVATGFSSWEVLRRHQRLPVAQAQRVMARTVRALLKETT